MMDFQNYDKVPPRHKCFLSGNPREQNGYVINFYGN